MINNMRISGIKFFEYSNGVKKEVPLDKLFYLVYDKVIEVAEYNFKLFGCPTSYRLYSMSAPLGRGISRERYLSHANDIENKYLAEVYVVDSKGRIKTIKLKISPRKDENFLNYLSGKDGTYLTKPPSVILAKSPSYGILIIREGRFYVKDFFCLEKRIHGIPLINSLEDLLKLGKGPYRGIIQEPFVLLLKGYTKLDLYVVSDLYTPINNPFATKAFLYIRKFYPLLETEGRNIGKDEIDELLLEFGKRQIEYGIELLDFGREQLGISYNKGVVVTDPEFAIIYHNDTRSLKKLCGSVIKMLAGISTNIPVGEVYKMCDQMIKSNSNIGIGYLELKKYMEEIEKRDGIDVIPKIIREIYNS